MNEKASPTQNAPGSGFSVVRVLVLVVIVCSVGGGVFYWMEAQNKPKPLVPFTGTVLYDGKPVTEGSVLAQNVDDRNDAAIGELNEDGTFSLMTNGEPGVRLGKHRVAISALKPGIPPTPLVPAIYVSTNTSPLAIDATDDPSKNTVVFELEGELPAPAQPMGPPGGAAPGTAPDRPAEESGDPGKGKSEAQNDATTE